MNYVSTDNLTWRVFCISVLTVQEDAEQGVKSPVWDESLRQPSVRVHLQHLPRWALQYISIQLSTKTNLLYRHIKYLSLKGCGLAIACAMFICFTAHEPVWSGLEGRDREFPHSDCRVLEGRWWGTDQGQWENGPWGFLRHCIIHQEDTSVS